MYIYTLRLAPRPSGSARAYHFRYYYLQWSIFIRILCRPGPTQPTDFCDDATLVRWIYRNITNLKIASTPARCSDQPPEFR